MPSNHTGKPLSKQTACSTSCGLIIIKSQSLHNILRTRTGTIRSIVRFIKRTIHPPSHFAILQRRYITTTLVFFAVGGAIKLFRTLLDIRIVEEYSALTLELLHYRAAAVMVKLRTT